MFQTKNNKELGSASKDDDFEDMISWGSPLSNSSNLSQDSANVSSTLDFLDDEDECASSQEDKKINFSFGHKTKEEDIDLNGKEAKYNSQSLFDSDEDNTLAQGTGTQVHNKHEANNNVVLETQAHNKHESNNNTVSDGIRETSRSSIEHTHVANREEPEEIHMPSKIKMDEKSHFWPQKSSLNDGFSQSSDENGLPFKNQTAPEKAQNHHEPRLTGISNELPSPKEIGKNNELEGSAYDRSKSMENIKEKNIQAVYTSPSPSTNDLSFSSFTTSSVKPNENPFNMPLGKEADRSKISSEGSEPDLFEDDTSKVGIDQNFHPLDEGSFSEHGFQKAFENSSVFKVLLIDDFSDLGALDFLGIGDESIFDPSIDAKIDGDLLNRALSEGHNFSDCLLSSLILPDSLSGNLIRYKLGYLPAENICFKPSNLYQILETHDKNLFKAFVASQEDKVLFFAIFYKMGLLDYEDCRDELDLNNPYHHHVLCKLGILHEESELTYEQDETLPANRDYVKRDVHFDEQKDFEPNNKEYIEPQDIHGNIPNETTGDFTVGNNDGLSVYSSNRSRPLFEDSNDSSDLFPGIENSLDEDARNALHGTENSHLIKNLDESLSSNDKELRDDCIQTAGSVENIGEGLSSLSIKPNRTVNLETDDTSSHSTNLETDDAEPSYSLIANVGSSENKELVTDEEEASSIKNTACQYENPNDENLVRDLPEVDDKADEDHYTTGESLDHPSEEYLDKSHDSNMPEDGHPDKPIYNNDSNSKSSSDLKSDASPFYKNKFSKSFADIFTLEGEASDKISTDVSSFIADATESDKPLIALSEAEEKSSVISSIFGIFKKKPAEPPQSKDDPYLNRYSRPKTAELKVPDKERKIVHTPYANKKQAGSFEIPGFKKANK